MKKRMQAWGPAWMILLTLIIFACDSSTPTPPPPTCTQSTVILQPSDGAIIPLGTTIAIIVSVPYKDLEIKINASTVLQNEYNGMPHKWQYQYDWTPATPGTYLVEARSSGYVCTSETGGCNAEFCNEGTSDQIEVTVFGVVSQTCIATSNANLYCRRGPAPAFEAIDSILPGQTMPVTGQSPDGKYLYLIGPNSKLPCTVPHNSEYIQLSGACQDLPFFTPEPTPVPVPAEKTHPKAPECSDGKDNDGDRLIDMRDPQCRNPDDNSESVP